MSEWKRAAADYSSVISAAPDAWSPYLMRGYCSAKQGSYSAAIADYEKSMQLAPQEAAVYNAFAWLLATALDDKVRDGAKAVTMAQKAVEITEGKDTNYMDTLGATFAEAGRFEEAVATQEKVLSLVPKDIDKKDLAEMKVRLGLYKKSKPFRDKLGK
jgi:tetratricopeptide (TPR) repeat protein